MNIIGKLTRNMEVHNLSNEKLGVNFSIAATDSYCNKQTNEFNRQCIVNALIGFIQQLQIF